MGIAVCGTMLIVIKEADKTASSSLFTFDTLSLIFVFI
jgi:hypothetical protein